MKSLNSIVITMEQLFSELERLEADPSYIGEMKQHINSMSILTLLQAKGPKVKEKASALLDKSK